MKRLIKPLAGCLMAVGVLFLLASFRIEAKALVAQVLLQRAWHDTVSTGTPVKAWSWADTTPYALLEMPALGKRVIVLEGTSGEAMAFGPGHMEGTPEPGDPGTSVIAAHRDTHFGFLKDVKPDDTFFLTTRSGEHITFRIIGTRIVRAENSGIDPSQGKGLVALVTCFPFDARISGPLRYVVLAEPVARLLASR